MTTYAKRCIDGRYRATPRAIVVVGGNVWIQWATSGEGQQPALVTSSHSTGTDDIKHVCKCLLGEDRPAGNAPPDDLLGHVCTIEVASYRVVKIEPDPFNATADLSNDPLYGVYLPAERMEDALRWCGLDLPPSARAKIQSAVRAKWGPPSVQKPADEGKPACAGSSSGNGGRI